MFYCASRTHFWLKQHFGSIERIQGRMRREWRRPRKRWTRVTVAIVEKRTTEEQRPEERMIEEARTDCNRRRFLRV